MQEMVDRNLQSSYLMPRQYFHLHRLLALAHFHPEMGFLLVLWVLMQNPTWDVTSKIISWWQSGGSSGMPHNNLLWKAHFHASFCCSVVSIKVTSIKSEYQQPKHLQNCRKLASLLPVIKFAHTIPQNCLPINDLRRPLNIQQKRTWEEN